MRDSPSSRLPLMPSQLGMRNGHLQDPESTAYSVALIGWYSGEGLTERVLVDATERGFRECETLLMRAGIDHSGAWYQQFDPDAEIPTHLVDLSAEPDPVASAREYAAREIRRPLQICGPELPFRHYVITLGEDSFAWVAVCHHMFMDGYGAELFRHRIGEILGALVAGAEIPGPALAGIADLIAEVPPPDPADLEFWKSHLAGAPEVISLAERVAPPAPLHSMTVVPVPRFASRVTGAPGHPNWAHVAAASAISYLSILLEEQAVVVGVPVTGRATDREKITPSQSMTTLPLHVAIDHSGSLPEVVRRFREALRSARPHQRQDFQTLRAELPVAFRTGRLYGPTVNVIPFELSVPIGEFETAAEVLLQGPVEDLAVTISPGPDDGVQVKVLVNPELYPAPVARTHAERLGRWLSQTADDPGAALEELVCLTPEEEAAHARMAATTAAGDQPRPLVWGTSCSVADLAGACGVTDVTGLSVRSALGRPSVFGSPGRVTLHSPDGDHRSELLVALEPDGLVYRGTAADRVTVNGSRVELEAVRAAVAGDPRHAGAEVTASGHRISVRLDETPDRAERESVARRIAAVTAVPVAVRGPRQG